jgi:uncharacterized membrane protein
MAESPERRTEEGFRRLIAFTDAVVAIALTLLILPLVDVVGDLTEGETVGQVYRDHSDEVIGFLISFAVIWVLWRNHHRMMENFRAYDRVIFDLHFVWMFTIVVLPFMTALISGHEMKGANLMYIVVLLVSIATLIAMSLWGRRHPELMETSPEGDAWRSAPPDFGTIVMLTLAFAVTALIPAVGLWSLLLLLLAGPANAVGMRVMHARQ